MGSLLKFEEEEEEEEEEEARYHDQLQERSRSLSAPSSSSSSSYSQKLVPWLSWDEWLFVEHSLFSDSPDSVASALKRILAWQSRGCLPVAIEVTASIIEIQQRDTHFRKDQLDGASINCRADQTSDASLSEEMLAMLYCMAIIRLVNGVVEKTRKKTEASIAVAADAIGIPRMLIDIRHEGSHRELPALKIVRRASVKALDWLKSYYWAPQKKAIPFQGDKTASIGEEIRSKLHELAFTLKVYQSPQCVSSLEKGKLYKKQITKSLKILVRLYSSFSTEVVSILLEFLLKAINSSDLVDLQEDSQVGPIMHTLLDDWKLVITKLSNKEPELLLTLLKAVLDMIETQKAMENETGRHHQASSDYRQEICQIEHLSFLFAWLVGSLKELKPRPHKDSAAEIKVSPTKTFLLDLLRKSLLVSAPANKQLLDSAIRLAQLIGNSSLMEKLKKLPLLGSSNSEEEIEIPSTTNFFVQHEESISQAAKKLELVKLRRLKSKVVETSAGDAENSNRWVLSRSWNPCPIGMLPHTLGSSGRLPVLDCHDGGKREASSDIELIDNTSVKKRRKTMEGCESDAVEGVEASSDIQLIDNTSVKKRRETMEGCESDAVKSVKGHLLIGGIWKGISEDELLALESEVRILA